METATQPIEIECQFCDFKGSVAEGAEHRQKTRHLIRIVKNDVAPLPQETPAPQEWQVIPFRSVNGVTTLWQIVDANRRMIANEIKSQELAGLIIKCVNRDPAFQKLVKAAQFALTTPGLIKGRDELQKAVDEVLRLAREGE